MITSFLMVQENAAFRHLLLPVQPLYTCGTTRTPSRPVTESLKKELGRRYYLSHLRPNTLCRRAPKDLTDDTVVKDIFRNNTTLASRETDHSSFSCGRKFPFSFFLTIIVTGL
jgi:hypothetical protein